MPSSSPYIPHHNHLKICNREGGEETFDWFKTYADLADLIHEVIPDRASRILMLGCGNSRLSEDVGIPPIIRTAVKY